MLTGFQDDGHVLAPLIALSRAADRSAAPLRWASNRPSARLISGRPRARRGPKASPELRGKSLHGHRTSKSLRGHRTSWCDDRAKAVRGTHNGVPAGGVGIGAELRVARPPLLVRRWRANRSKRQDQSALRQPRDGKSGMAHRRLKVSQKRKRSPTVGSIVLRLR